MRKQFNERGLSPPAPFQEREYRSPERQGSYLSAVQVPADPNFCSPPPHLYLSQQSPRAPAARPPRTPAHLNSNSTAALPRRPPAANPDPAPHSPPSLPVAPSCPALPLRSLRRPMDWSSHRKLSAREGAGGQVSREGGREK